MTKQVISKFDEYNLRRFSSPWVSLVTEAGEYDFSQKVGTFTGDKGESGDLVVFDPVVGQVYGYGQKDYRGSNTVKKFAKWTGNEFSECNKLGDEIND